MKTHLCKLLLLTASIFCGQVNLFSQSTVTVTLSSAGEGSWVVPCGVSSITVHLWGGGGAAGGVQSGVTKATGGGGGGGGYASSSYVVTAGSTLSYTVGAAGTQHPAGGDGGNGSATTFSTTIANGGLGGTSANASGTGFAGGAGASGSVGTTTLAGANGATGSVGAGLYTGGTGGNAANTAGGGGTGGTGIIGNSGNSGNAPGGGGGGGSVGTGPAGTLPTFGGSGGSGQVTIVYSLPIVVNAGSDITAACTATSTAFNLAATAAASGYTGSWSTGNASVTITTPSSNTSQVTNSGLGFTPGSSTSFYWTVTNGSCTYQDEVVVSFGACAQSNPECTSAFSLTANASLLCGQRTNGFGGGADGCAISGTGQTVWYKFAATNDSMVLNILGTSQYYPNYGVFPTCPAVCSTNKTYSLSAGDPGKHSVVTGLSIGTTYYIEIQASNSIDETFCISINDMAKNSIAPLQATAIGTCGVTYNGTTNGGYYASTGSNMDSDGTNEVSFVINDISWFKFCPSAASSYSITFDVTSCVFTGVNSGSQMAILSGTVGATLATTTLSPIWQAPSPTYASAAPVSSPTFAVASGACVYLLVDGFAGDACSYSYIVNPVGNTCLLLPIELMSFSATGRNGVVDLVWATAFEKNNDYYTVERSQDAINFESLKTVEGAGNSGVQKRYFVVDNNPLSGISYYRLKQTDFSGRYTYSEIQAVDMDKTNKFEVNIFPNPLDKGAELNISINSMKNDIVNIVIMNSSGDVVTTKDIKFESANPLIQVKHEFEPGIYFMKISNKKGEIITRKVVVK
ncbi:MAG: T9SS type A sorting domain-containing protein [Bacteroidota bacterium]